MNLSRKRKSENILPMKQRTKYNNTYLANKSLPNTFNLSFERDVLNLTDSLNDNLKDLEADSLLSQRFKYNTKLKQNDLNKYNFFYNRKTHLFSNIQKNFNFFHQNIKFQSKIFIVYIFILMLVRISLAYDCFGETLEGRQCTGVDSVLKNRCDGGGTIPTGKQCIVSTPVKRGECISPNFCSCYQGWGGFDCRYSTCSDVLYTDSNVCSSRGTCAGQNYCRCWANGGSESSGPPLYAGDNCEYPICNSKISTDPTVCNGRAISNVPTGSNGCYEPNKCDCNNVGDWGYSGDDCEEMKCNNQYGTDACSGPTHGVCVLKTDSSVLGGRNRCSCLTGWASADTLDDTGICNLPVCYNLRSVDSGVCSNHGTCINPDSCSCTTGWIGDECQYYTCNGIAYNSGSVCNNGRGTCSAVDTCNCVTGWRNGPSNNCEIKTCNSLDHDDPDVCSGHGACNPNEIDSENDKCICSTGYEGTLCNLYRCNNILSGDPDVCNGHGTCGSPDTCSCSTGWTGEFCQYPVCNSIASTDSTVCSGRGTCTNPDTCSCNSGYTGPNCEYPICYGVPSTSSLTCSERGTCVSPNKCSCNTGYIGLECQLIHCYGKYTNDPKICSGHGSCISPQTCSCNAGYVGDNCETPLCYTIRSDDSTVCNGHGTCTSPDTCKCTGGWYGTECQDSICVDRETSCSGHGSCNDNHTVCICDTNYVESNCSQHLCFGIRADNPDVCSGYGNCTYPDTCECNDYKYGGEKCNLPGCFGKNATDPTICSSPNGTCIEVDKCQCVTYLGYMNHECNNPICFDAGANSDLVCSKHGECIDNDLCICESGWEGLDCSKPTCNGYSNDSVDVCNGHGSCVNLDKCICNYDYSGQYCQYPICYGISASSSISCAGHGDCISPDHCVCWDETKFSGYNCEKPNCYGIVSNNFTVCSGRGLCIAEDLCICNDTKSVGPQCETDVCFGIPSSNTSVCSGRGTCTNQDVCTCDYGYGGSKCDYHLCFDIPYNTTNVCSGHGECSNVDFCICNPTHIGTKCEYVKCGGVPEHVYCNNHGTCVEGNACFCDTNYFGAYCNKYYEICSNSYAIGSVDYPCSTCLGSDNGLQDCPIYISPSWYLEAQKNGEATLTGWYKVLNRPVSMTSVDCLKVLSLTTVNRLGNFATCRWISPTSAAFVINLGLNQLMETNSPLEFKLTPFDSEVILLFTAKASANNTEPGIQKVIDSDNDSLLIYAISIPASAGTAFIILCCFASLICCCFIICLRPNRKFVEVAKTYIKDPNEDRRLAILEQLKKEKDQQEAKRIMNIRSRLLDLQSNSEISKELEERRTKLQEDEVQLFQDRLNIEKVKYGLSGRYAKSAPKKMNQNFILQDDLSEQSFSSSTSSDAKIAFRIPESEEDLDETLLAVENGILSKTLGRR